MSYSKHVWPSVSGRSGTLPSRKTWLQLLRHGVDSLRAAWRERRERMEAARILSGYQDWELWDLGLSRSDIAGIANGTYRRD